MSLADATKINVLVQNPVSPFGGATVKLPERDIQVEINPNPAAVQSVFGRTGNVVARLEDFETFYAPLDRALPPGGLEGQIITKLSSAPNDAQWSDPPTAGLANPTALIGMSAVNGTSLDAIRSDAAPAINPAIAPDWTGTHIFHASPAVPTPTLNQHAANKSYVDSAVGGGVTPAALSTADDVNVTAFLTGTPLTALLQPVGLHLGWTGTLSKARGGTAQSNQSVAAHSYFGNNTGSTAAAGFNQIDYSELTGTPSAITPAALTKTDDTNVTLALVGSPTTALLQATQLNLGWTGTLSRTRGGLGVSGNGIAAHTFFGNNTGSSGNGAFVQPNISDILGDTSTALGIGSLELGHASDTTLSRLSAGVLGVEGVAVLLSGGALGTPTSGDLSNCTFPTLNQSTTGSAAKISFSGQTGLMNFTGITSTNRQKTVRDAADTLLELGGSYTPTGTWTSLNLVTPVLGTPASGTLTNCSGLPISGLVASTSLALGVGTIELGHASDTTLSRASAGVLAVEGVNVLLNGGALGTPVSGTLTNCTGLPITGLVASTSTALGVGSIELGHASDTTVARSGAGAITVEGVQVLLSGAALGTPASGTLTNCTALPIAGLTASTSTAIGVGSVELGHASDTTLSRSAAGIMAVEGIDIPPRFTIRAASTVTQASDTNPHAVFTTPANGRFTPPSTGTWHFEAVLQYSSMSGTSGNLKIDILGAGTATCTNWSWQAWGNDNTSNPSANGGSLNTTSASPASIVSAGTGTTLGVTIRGSVEVTGLGTIIPTQTLVTAAAAVLGIGSFFTFWRAGPTGMTSVGPWD